jgi:hypothetical protein
MEKRTLRLRAPELRGWDLDRPERIALDARFGGSHRDAPVKFCLIVPLNEKKGTPQRPLYP